MSIVKKPLYIQRKLLNGKELFDWAKQNGFETVVPVEEMHVTIAFSREPLYWPSALTDLVIIPEGYGDRTVSFLGSEGAVVMKFSSITLSKRWKEIRNMGASWDYESYQPHVTISYKDNTDKDLSSIKPFSGPLIFGEELVQDLNLDWKSTFKEE